MSLASLLQVGVKFRVSWRQGYSQVQPACLIVPMAGSCLALSAQEIPSSSGVVSHPLQDCCLINITIFIVVDCCAEFKMLDCDVLRSHMHAPSCRCSSKSYEAHTLSVRSRLLDNIIVGMCVIWYMDSHVHPAPCLHWH